MPWTVYTFFDYSGDVIYAGCSRDFDGRLYRHAYVRTWFNEVKAVRKVEFPTERDARDAEYSIIAAEAPRYNERGTDICPRCRTNLRGNNRRAVYCTPCQKEYQIERKTRLGWTPRQPPTTTCPRCQGVKAQGPGYCRPCKKEVNAAYRAAGRA